MVEARALAVFRSSIHDLFSQAQTTYNEGGHLPIDTGFLRNSFVAALNGSTALQGPNAYEFAVSAAELGDTLFGGWTADYARRMEYGFVGTDALGRNYNQRGFGFVAHAAANWVQIVEGNAKRLRTMTG